ncbi:AbiEi antitoxin N-terminal domain-containing protein [Agrobacterium cavarae]|uniref:AbiEi antitoxin N-terminal domain-containing protein n=1 Tax=Agrobacterium cavarae TaxID=2528239 RepID=UPI003FD403E4
MVVDAAWLEERGIASNLRAYYVKNDWLEQPVRSVYRKPRGELNWQPSRTDVCRRIYLMPSGGPD